MTKMLSFKYPSSKARELAELVKKMGKSPSYVKKWLTLQTGERKRVKILG
jgi:hypothetical protein